MFWIFVLIASVWGDSNKYPKHIMLEGLKQYICIISKKKKKMHLLSERYYENTPIQIYIKFHLQKLKVFRYKNSDIFHISAQNIDCGYSLEPPRRGGSYEYPQSMFWAEIWKIMYTPVNPSFTI